MRHPVLAVTISALIAAAPLSAQTPDFGSDASPFALDGECDDPRFAGPGMTQTRLLDSDIRADATDCRQAFEAGQVTLADGAAPGKAPAPAPLTVPPPQGAADFGDDSGDWPHDGECDDRRFAGPGMAVSLAWDQTGRDASDCRRLATAGTVRRWIPAEAAAATQCSALDFGDDSGAFASDGECDDIRFEGPGTASRIGPDQIGTDATDCSRLCRFGVIALRDY